MAVAMSEPKTKRGLHAARHMEFAASLVVSLVMLFYAGCAAQTSDSRSAAATPAGVEEKPLVAQRSDADAALEVKPGDGDEQAATAAAERALDRLSKELAAVLLATGAAESPSVAIYPLKADKYAEALCTVVEDEVAIGLAREGGKRLMVIQRRWTESCIEEIARSRDAMYDEETALKLGRQLAAKYLVAGSVTSSAQAIRVNAKVIEAETSRLLGGAGASIALSEILGVDPSAMQSGRRSDDLVEAPAEKFLTGESAERYTLLGDRCYDRGMIEDAEKYYRLALRAGGLSAQGKSRALTRLGYVAQSRKETDKADDLYRQALAAEPDQLRATAQRKYGRRYADRMHELQSLWFDSKRGQALPQNSKPAHFALDVVKLVGEGGRLRAVKLRPGDYLHSGTSKFKAVFRCDKPIYVYAWNLDSTGKVWPIWPRFPDRMSADWTPSPIAPDRAYDVPSDINWFVLDDNVGCEYIFYVASDRRIPELEALLAFFNENKNPRDLDKNIEVAPAPVFAVATRGVDIRHRGIKAEVAVQDTAGNAVDYRLDAFALTRTESAGVVWFRHVD